MTIQSGWLWNRHSFLVKLHFHVQRHPHPSCDGQDKGRGQPVDRHSVAELKLNQPVVRYIMDEMPIACHFVIGYTCAWETSHTVDFCRWMW